MSFLKGLWRTPEQRRTVTVEVFGVPCTLYADACTSFIERYLNRYSTICAQCGKPIFPGESVERAWNDAPHPYVHCTFQCGEGAFWCGTWGEGELIPIDETHETIERDGQIVICPKRVA